MIPPAPFTPPPITSQAPPLPPLDLPTSTSPLAASFHPHSPLSSHSPMAVEPSLAPALVPRHVTGPIDPSRGKKRALEDAPVLGLSAQSMMNEDRVIAPLKSARRLRSAQPPSTPSTPTNVSPSRESSPGLDAASASSPVKRARTSSLSGEIYNFHILPSSDDEMDGADPSPVSSPSTRLRARFNQLLGPSPLHKSFSSTTVPHPPTIEEQDMSLVSSTSTRTIAAPSSMAEGPKIKTRAKALLSKVESVEMDDANIEMNKVFMLVHGRGMGMSSSSGGRHLRRGSGLRPKMSDEHMDID
ncbi:hypothetical protein DB88DRAFT_168233 [Papiliotrema laurentii]|uniref:Uncharacterized protein n=1 Tax=Papiliotrema laurentii TaxID=5418 RepID=A0AAD9L820_PAPLA|nr:hypothetical protein DB88DRAFT_168233 [Papiliotrema laurentii]